MGPCDFQNNNVTYLRKGLSLWLVQTFLKDFPLVFVECFPGHPDDFALKKVLAFVVPMGHEKKLVTRYVLSSTL
jgi:hypothetical protein